MASLALAGLFFAAIHLGVSGTTLRNALVARFGLRAYMIGFSAASLLGMVWLVAAYKGANYVPTWGPLQWWKPFAIVLMLPAFLLAVIGLTTPNPTSVRGAGRSSGPGAHRHPAGHAASVSDRSWTLGRHTLHR